MLTIIVTQLDLSRPGMGRGMLSFNEKLNEIAVCKKHTSTLGTSSRHIYGLIKPASGFVVNIKVYIISCLFSTNDWLRRWLLRSWNQPQIAKWGIPCKCQYLSAEPLGGICETPLEYRSTSSAVDWKLSSSPLAWRWISPRRPTTLDAHRSCRVWPAC